MSDNTPFGNMPSSNTPSGNLFAELGGDSKAARAELSRLKTFVQRRVPGGRKRRMTHIIDMAARRKSGDIRTLKELRRAMGRLPPRRVSAARARSRLRALPLVEKELPRPPQRYLDIGCSEGGLTRAYGEALGLAPADIHGTDIRNIGDQPGFVFSQADSADLPFADDTFDVITLNMALHHFPNLQASLAEVRRVLTGDGVVLIREHDARAGGPTAAYLNLVHDLYSVVLGDEMPFDEFQRRRTSAVHGRYRTVAEWDEAFAEAGFRRAGLRLEHDAFDSFHAVYRPT